MLCTEWTIAQRLSVHLRHYLFTQVHVGTHKWMDGHTPALLIGYERTKNSKIINNTMAGNSFYYVCTNASYSTW